MILLFVPTISLYAQVIPIDSAKIKTKIAVVDARHFKITKTIRRARQRRLLLNSSDYFMPTASTVSDPRLLKDSVYVQAYKNAAYNRSVHNGKSGYYAVAAAEVVVGVVAAAALTVLLLTALLRGIHIK